MDGLYINDSTKVFNDKDYYHKIFTKSVKLKAVSEIVCSRSMLGI